MSGSVAIWKKSAIKKLILLVNSLVFNFGWDTVFVNILNFMFLTVFVGFSSVAWYILDNERSQ